MNTLKFFLPAILIAVISCTNTSQVHNTLSPEEISEGWTLLFDGENMDQWRSFHKDTLLGWVVEAGTMKALGFGGEQEGDIITRKTYTDFELSLEWKISPQGNSGVLYMVQEDTAYHAIYESGPEYQLLDDLDFPEELEDWQLTAANYAMHTIQNKVLNPVGEWNSTRIIKKNKHVEHWLNGQKVVEYELWTEDWHSRVAAGKWKDYPGYGKIETGHIALQDHGAPIWFRNVKIREL